MTDVRAFDRDLSGLLTDLASRSSPPTEMTSSGGPR